MAIGCLRGESRGEGTVEGCTVDMLLCCGYVIVLVTADRLPPPNGVANTIVAILQSLGSYDHCLSSQTTIAYHSLLREMVILLGTYGDSRDSSTAYVVLHRCTYLVGCMPCALKIFFLLEYWYTVGYT